MKETELKNFINSNSNFIYEYINIQILQDIAVMNKEYFLKVIKDIFADKRSKEEILNIKNPNILPYFIFTLLENSGKMDYTSLRTDTINFNQINKEASTYYNYVRFSLKDDFLTINLMQSKMGGMAINEDIVKYSKDIPIKNKGLEEFISK